MGVDDRPALRGRGDLGKQLGRARGGDGENHLVLGRDGDALNPEVESDGLPARCLEGAQTVREVDPAAPRADGGQGRIDEASRQPLRGDAGTPGRLAAAEDLRHHRPQQLGRPFLGGGVEDGDGEGLPEAAIERPGGVEALGDGRLGAGAEERQGSEVIGGAAFGHPPRGPEDPPRHEAGVGTHGPAPSAPELDEGKGGAGGARQAAGGANLVEIGHHRAVSRKQQVVAVVDRAAEDVVEERAAAPAGMGRRLVKRDPAARFERTHRAGQAGDSGADDVDHWHQNTPWRRAIQSFSILDRPTGSSRRSQPRRSSRPSRRR